MTSPAEAQSKLATSSDPAIANPAEDASGRQPTASSPAAAELASTKISLHNALRRFPDFPIPGINFIDIMPWFLDPSIHATLLRSLELQLLHFGESNAAVKPDVVVGLDARGFLFGPSLALKLDASFVPVRKKGKLPGPCVTAAYEKEYGADYFQMQEGSIKPGQKVLVVDDIIATGGSAAAAGDLVKQLGGTLVGYLFIVEISFLKGREKLGDVPIVTLLEEAD
ncbi:putative adenine phosphoribosyltransferase protein [Phaeoacremonium minimum UCRPA7]|uniref:adenine phosphoribosyltransferase n=1 Tax=Phaeoacremonium minimum (strain UCR-PA7) TaxID=1286976 RepID=R8BG92_PHAM7|nr:putative adenine phosphoribosyltransferase protein [Phaeoacremonium minimum UCRPA7]EON98321.1 putative adenine phosphoribosyltransferase protein [Phaeoacremonium minimum UCRPA7]